MSDDEPTTIYYTLPQIAAEMRMSERWVRGELADKAKGIEHARPGGKIRMTPEQLKAFQLRYNVGGVGKGSITTGRKRAS